VQEQNNQDTDQIADLYRRAPREISQVWYNRSDAIANAAEDFVVARQQLFAFSR
jgi:chromosome partitioning protein